MVAEHSNMFFFSKNIINYIVFFVMFEIETTLSNKIFNKCVYLKE